MLKLIDFGLAADVSDGTVVLVERAAAVDKSRLASVADLARFKLSLTGHPRCPVTRSPT